MFEPTGHESTDRSSAFDGLARRAGLSGVSPHLAVGICVLVTLAVVAGAWRFLAHRPAEEFAFEARAVVSEDIEEAESPGDSGGGDAPPATVWVHVAGAVIRPGLYEMPSGARAGDALAVAGGPVEGACVDAVNLARTLEDGEQVYVPSREEVDSGSVAGAAAAAGGGAAGLSPGASAGGLVDINRASESELVALPGVGPATAGKIVADREANGPFASPEDLMRVSGIGDKKFEALRDLITVR